MAGFRKGNSNDLATLLVELVSKQKDLIANMLKKIIVFMAEADMDVETEFTKKAMSFFCELISIF